ncbi:hypothetical protein CEP52_015529 [Fusarium oligoseptatum]|uniref:Peptidase S33 tripeptidyl aminopeptidase-like C-terminal domain-containing protein n=1 Tax=Fusarium oligoseptatum TaxID=2604345 RepID=A0A428SCG9_9HYPO|nr:hypothetical protein CEP52_015529 [Fusarium oligoseptatum]
MKNPAPNPRFSGRNQRRAMSYAAPTACLVIILFVCFAKLDSYLVPSTPRYGDATGIAGKTSATTTPTLTSPYGRFPEAKDPFHFIPCTNLSLPPQIDDPDPDRTWASLFNPDPQQWSWGRRVRHGQDDHNNELDARRDDQYDGRGIYLCGYLDLPLDYQNDSDTRIVRLAVTKFQVSGLARIDRTELQTEPTPGRKSRRTIVIEPGGPGGSGTGELWQEAEGVTNKLSDGQFDVLGWDPRGTNASQPTWTCYSDGAYRDRWKLLRRKHREELADPISHLRTVDAINNATFLACHQLHGDVGRFLGTTSVTRDLDEIRKALGEEELTGYLISYGTAIGQTYASMFPNHVGRLILDGTDNYKNYRQLGGFAWYSLDNVTDAWRDGFLGECLKAGPEYCALAKPPSSRIKGPVTLAGLDSRMQALFQSLTTQPLPGFTESGGPALITHSQLALMLYIALYDPKTWPDTAQMLFELEAGNSTLAAGFVEKAWYHPPTSPLHRFISPEEFLWLVVCADAFDAPQPEDGLLWWDRLWSNMTDQSWLSATFRLSIVLPCRHFNTYWPNPPWVHRGDLSHTLRTPIVFIAGTYDPATPLRPARNLAKEMGQNARLVIHHGYGHTSRQDPSNCTDAIGKAYMLNGTLPNELETHCYANQSPYLPTRA